MGIFLAPVQRSWGSFYNIVSHSVTVNCCSRIRGHPYGKGYLLVTQTHNLTWFLAPFFNFWIVCSLLLLTWYFLPLWRATCIFLQRFVEPSRSAIFFFWLSHVSCFFPKTCELSVALLKGCAGKHRNIFSVLWCRTRLPCTPDKPCLVRPPKALCRKERGSELCYPLGSVLKEPAAWRADP